MAGEIELVSDGDGVAIFGDPDEVERFLTAANLPSKNLDLKGTLKTSLVAGSVITQAGAQLSANSGRWVKLTKESAQALKLGKAMQGSASGVSRAIATTSKGKITKVLEFTKQGSLGSILTNPAMLAGAAGIMAQLAMQQTMDEITEYLAVIDKKLDEILRVQKDAVLAELDGVSFSIDDAMLKWEHTGRVSEVTWSNLHGSAQTIATVQGNALRRLAAETEQMEKSSRAGDLDQLPAVESTVMEWCAVLARCFQLQDALGILELGRVLETDPDDVEKHCAAIRAGRAKRRDHIATSTSQLLSRMDAAAREANGRALLHPHKANRIVSTQNVVVSRVTEFYEIIGITSVLDSIELKRWREAANDARKKVVHSVEMGASVTARFGGETLRNTTSFAAESSAKITKRLSRRRLSTPSEEHQDGNPTEASDHS